MLFRSILGEVGDYPVEEEMSDFDTEMDLESGSIEMTGQESMSYGKTGTAYNSSVAGEASNAGEGLGSETMSALQGNGIPSVSQEKGILDEVGTSSVFGFDAAKLRCLMRQDLARRREHLPHSILHGLGELLAGALDPGGRAELASDVDDVATAHFEMAGPVDAAAGRVHG